MGIGFKRFLTAFQDVARRAERVSPFGDRAAQRSIEAPTDVFGLEDSAITREVPANITVDDGQARVGECEVAV